MISKQIEKPRFLESGRGVFIFFGEHSQKLNNTAQKILIVSLAEDEQNIFTQ